MAYINTFTGMTHKEKTIPQLSRGGGVVTPRQTTLSGQTG
jgi:hypothetical protein